MKAHVVVVDVRQSGPDTWESIPLVLDVDETTTVGEIRAWMARNRLIPAPTWGPAVATLTMRDEPEVDDAR